MGNYSIKELESLSGIKAHTIRIWEKRHELISPSRTDTNIRYYSDHDLKKLLNISILNNHGVKISKIASLSLDEIVNQASELTSNQNVSIEAYIDQLTICMVDLDEDKFEKLLSRYIMKFGFEETITQIIYPFLEKIGVLWLSNNINPVQEHFISNLIRQKMIVAIDDLETTKVGDAKKAILFLPEDELHELGLLFIHYLVKSHGFKTYYFGQTVPLSDLISAHETLKADILITAISYISSDKAFKKYIADLSKVSSKVPVYITGQPIFNLKDLPHNVRPFIKPQDILPILP